MTCREKKEISNRVWDEGAKVPYEARGQGSSLVLAGSTDAHPRDRGKAEHWDPEPVESLLGEGKVIC